MPLARVVVEPGQCYITGPVPHQTLNDLLAIQIPGAEHADSFKNRREYLRLRAMVTRTVEEDRELEQRAKAKMWDGYHRLYHKKGGVGLFPTGLLERVVEALESQGYTFDFIKKLPDDKPFLSYPAMQLSERNYQAEAAETAYEVRRGIIEIGTGGGKTATAAGIIARTGVTTLFLVNTKDLLYQAIEAFAGIFYEGDVERIGQIGDGVCRLRPITIGTMQSVCAGLGVKFQAADDEGGTDKTGLPALSGKPFMEFWGIEPDQDLATYQGPAPGPWLCPTPPIAVQTAVAHAGCVIVDECQHVACDTILAILAQAKNAAWLIGLSATPERDDGLTLVMEGALAGVCYKKTASDLIREGWLVTPKCFFHHAPTVKPNERNFQKALSAEIIENVERNELAMNLGTDGKRTLYLVKFLTHGKDVAGRIAAVTGSQCPFLTGKEATASRRKLLADLENGNLPRLVATTLADEGLNIPPLFRVVNVGGGKSFSRTKQRVGRITRKFPGKVFGEYHDFLDAQKHLVDWSEKRLSACRSEPEFRVFIK